MTAVGRVEVVVFDLGGVVCKFEPEARLAALAVATGLDEAQIKDAIWTSGLDAAADRGELELADALASVIAALGHRIAEAPLLQAWTKAFVPDPAVVELANSLDRQTAIFTNNGPMLEECMHRGLVRAGDAFDPILFAGHLRATKPDPISYERAAAALGHDAAALLLVDDAEKNVSGALQSGWRAIHFESPAQLEQELRVAGVSA